LTIQGFLDKLDGLSRFWGKIMAVESILKNIKRKTIVTGHYGSGKTEFSVSLAMLMSRLLNEDPSLNATTQENRPPVYQENRPPGSPVLALIDLDVINPYFRSREQKKMLESAGVSIYGSAFEDEVTVENPALAANLRAPLESRSCRVIIDTGGNDSGAVVLNQFSKYFKDDETTVLAIVNANRPETSSIDSAIEHIRAIEFITNLNVSFIVNNTHLLRETTVDDISKGHEFCKKICDLTKKRLLCDCYPDGIIDPGDLTGFSENLMPLGLHMRPTWLDK